MVDHLLTNGRWIEGPEFLWEKEEEWPESSLDSDVAADDPEVKRELTANAVIVDDTPSATHRLITWLEKVKEVSCMAVENKEGSTGDEEKIWVKRTLT